MGSTSPTFDTSSTNSIIFDGLTQYIEVPTISFIPLNGFSFVATIKLSSSISIGSTLFVIGNDLAMTNYLAIVYSAVNTLAFRICVSSTIYDITQTVSLNTQYHIVFTFNPPNTITIYINNVSVNNTTTIILPSQSSYTYNSIGCTFTSGGIPTGNAAFTCYNYNFYPRGFSANDVSTNYAINSIIGINSSLPLQNQPIPTGTLMDLSLTQNEIINISSVTPSMTTTGATITFAGNYVTASIGYSTLSLTNQTSPASITSLSPNTSYTFTVIPYNSSGLTNNYGILSAIGVTLGIVGGQSISLGSSATSLTASWGANNTGGYYYTSVSVAWSPSTAGSPTIVSNSQTSYTPTNLTANTSYTFTITPLNSVSATGSAVTTGSLYTYGSVTGVAAGTYLANGTGFRVSWTTSATWTTINITGTAGTFSAISASFKDFTGLSPNTSYTVNVYPVNFQSAQNNNGIQTVTPVTYATVTGISVGTYLSNGTGFTVSWSASGTSGTSWYQINISGCGTYNNISGTSQAVTGLTANTSYTVALSPLNTASAVNTSYQTSTVVTLATISSSTGSSSNVTTTSCTITWATGTYTNVTISVSPSVSGFPTTQTGTSYGVTGLTVSTAYIFTITPNNSASVGNTGNQATINVTTTSGGASGTNYTYTGADQSLTVPANAISMTVYAWGAGGASKGYGNSTLPVSGTGGGGGFVQGTISVTPGQVYNIVVGGGGNYSAPGGQSTSTYGGGAGCISLSGDGNWRNSSGGGRSAVQFSSADIITAGGGGGGGISQAGQLSDGGPGGGTTGGAVNTAYGGGGGGTQSAGGAAGQYNTSVGSAGSRPSAGSQYTGGTGNNYAGGGGGGYYGGGGGDTTWSSTAVMAGGGGGSSYTGTATSIVNTQASGATVANNVGLPSGYSGTIGNGGASVTATSGQAGNIGQNGLVVISFTYSASPSLTVPVPFFNGFRFMLQDYSSGYYVCADGSTKFLCSASSTLANATIFQVYNNSAVYNNGSGGVALQTYMGQYSDGGYMRHAGYTCYSNGFAGNNFDFAWLFQTTGTQNVFTIYNWYGGNYYLDIVSNYLQISPGSSRQWKVIPYDYNAVSASGLFTNSYNLYHWYIASQSVSGNTWTDLSGNSRTGTGSGTITATTDAVSANGNVNAIPYVYGGTSATVTFGGTVPNPYTIMTVSRYSSTTGTNYRRIIQSYTGGSQNSVEGHYTGCAGVIYHNNWNFPSASGATAYITPNTSWTFTTSTSSASRLIVQGNTQNSGLTSTSAIGGSAGSSAGGSSFNINLYAPDTSDWAFAELGTWNRELNAYEMSLINSYIYRRYGIGAAPAMNIGSVGYLVFSHKIVLNSGVYFANATEAATTGTLSVVTSSAQHKYSILSQIANFRRSNGTYEFIFYICTDDTNFTSMPYRRWTQTSNPYTTSGAATGYTAVTEGWTIQEPVGGLKQSSYTSQTLFDIDTGSGWWGAVGQYAAYSGGFPEDNVVRTFIQLWMV